MERSQVRYINEYNKENYKMYPFRVKRSDIELINKLESVSSKNSYITNLIKEDLHPSVLTLKQIKEAIKPVMDKHNIKEVYLFGSYSRGEANRNSDIDIYCEKGDVDTLWKQSAFRDELEKALGKEVDLVIIGSDMPEYFKEQLEKDLIKLC